MEYLQSYIETIVFVSPQSISLEEITKTLEAVSQQVIDPVIVQEQLGLIELKHQQVDSIFELKQLAGGYQFLTKKAFYPIVNQLQLQHAKKKLSQSALETLAIIAYRQPITKQEVEQIRGVNCDYAIQKLLEKELISLMGKAEAVGRPMLYGTSSLFADYFGIHSIADLPQLKDIQAKEGNVIGNQHSEY